MTPVVRKAERGYQLCRNSAHWQSSLCKGSQDLTTDLARQATASVGRTRPAVRMAKIELLLARRSRIHPPIRVCVAECVVLRYDSLSRRADVPLRERRAAMVSRALGNARDGTSSGRTLHRSGRDWRRCSEAAFYEANLKVAGAYAHSQSSRRRYAVLVLP